MNWTILALAVAAAIGFAWAFLERKSRKGTERKSIVVNEIAGDNKDLEESKLASESALGLELVTIANEAEKATEEARTRIEHIESLPVPSSALEALKQLQKEGIIK